MHTLRLALLSWGALLGCTAVIGVARAQQLGSWEEDGNSLLVKWMWRATMERAMGGSRCHWSENPLGKARELLTGHIGGQDTAVEAMLAAIQSWTIQ